MTIATAGPFIVELHGPSTYRVAVHSTDGPTLLAAYATILRNSLRPHGPALIRVHLTRTGLIALLGTPGGAYSPRATITPREARAWLRHWDRAGRQTPTAAHLPASAALTQAILGGDSHKAAQALTAAPVPASHQYALALAAAEATKAT